MSDEADGKAYGAFQDGLRLLDLSVDGFWNSFFAIVIALPPLAVSWVGAANDLSQLSAESAANSRSSPGWR